MLRRSLSRPRSGGLGSDVGLNLGHSLEEAAARLGLPEVSRNLSLAAPGVVVPICVAVVVVCVAVVAVAWLTSNTMTILSTAPVSFLTFVAVLLLLLLLFLLALVYLLRH